MKKNNYTLVLGGGGANGAYQIGAWKAFKELKIKFSSVIGNSVGALNGALIIMDKYKEASSIWENISIDKIVKIPDKLMKNGKFNIDLSKVSIFNEIKLLFINKGFDTQPLRDLIENHIDENAIRRSGIDFGIVTYLVDEFKPLELFIEDIEDGKLIDYMIASASLPVIFKSMKLDGKKLIDGGVHDNIPFSLAKQRGYKNIIIVDISGLGVNKKPEIEGTNTIYIKNSQELGNIIDFDPGNAKKFITLGYLDTLKVFNKVDGIKYFYKDKRKLLKKLESILFDPKTINDYKKYLISKDNISTAGKPEIRKKIMEILPKHFFNHKSIISVLMECAALSLKIDIFRLYDIKELVSLINEKYESIEKKADDKVRYRNLFDLFTKELTKIKSISDIKNIFNRSSFEYEKEIEVLFSMDSKYEESHLKILSAIFPDIIGAKIFFIVLKRYFKR